MTLPAGFLLGRSVVSRRIRLFALLVLGAASGCNLNPQPEPPSAVGSQDGGSGGFQSGNGGALGAGGAGTGGQSSGSGGLYDTDAAVPSSDAAADAAPPEAGVTDGAANAEGG